jgi:hypothetical protein
MRPTKADLVPAGSAAALELADKHPHKRNKARNNKGDDDNVFHGNGKRGGKDSSHEKGCPISPVRGPEGRLCETTGRRTSQECWKAAQQVNAKSKSVRRFRSKPGHQFVDKLLTGKVFELIDINVVKEPKLGLNGQVRVLKRKPFGAQK